MYETLDDLENSQNTKVKSNKRILKFLPRNFIGILIGLGLIIIFILLLKGVAGLIYSFRPTYLQWATNDNVHLFVNILLISISIYFEILLIYLVIIRISNISSKLKKYLRNILLIILPFLLLLSRVGFTMAGIIPNWLGIEKLGNVCSDCKGGIIVHGPAFFGGEIPKIDGNVCCPGTYHYHINHNLMKPIIYLYPITESKINVKLGNPDNLSHTYPKYDSVKGRNLIAKPNGDLKDIETGRKLYGLYREGKSDNETNFDEGFIVAGKDIIPFLEEKLAILGLNEREAEEFIVYRLPQMENNERNLIRFETKTEQDENMPLNITPKPDTVIRVMMDWKAINEPIDVLEQQLEKSERNGFTVVEWGGSPRN